MNATSASPEKVPRKRGRRGGVTSPMVRTVVAPLNFANINSGTRFNEVPSAVNEWQKMLGNFRPEIDRNHLEWAEFQDMGSDF